jgi:hypothetical protein
MNLEMLPDEALEKIHEAIREAYEESDDLALRSNPDWKDWRDSLEALLTARGIDFDHLVLEGEPGREDDDEEEDDEDGDEDEDDDRPHRRGQSDDGDDEDGGDDDQDDGGDEDDDGAKRRRR